MPAKKIKIPGSIEAAQDRLVALDGIATATGWERAAIVYAFTYKGKNRFDSSREVVSYTIIGFSRLGIKGLVTQDSVRHHRNAWEEALTNGEVTDIQPGDTVTLPSREFPETRTGTDGYNTEEGAERTIKRIVDKHGPQVVAKTVATEPKVAAAVVENKAANKGVIQAQSKRTRRLVNQRKEAVAAAGADTKGQVNDAVTSGPGLGAMDNSVGYGRVRRGQSEMVSGWIESTKEQSLNPFDLHLLVADQAALERHVAERRVVVEAVAEGVDPWSALAEHRADYEEQFQREMDEAESGTTFDDVDDIEKFANEGA